MLSSTFPNFSGVFTPRVPHCPRANPNPLQAFRDSRISLTRFGICKPCHLLTPGLILIESYMNCCRRVEESKQEIELGLSEPCSTARKNYVPFWDCMSESKIKDALYKPNVPTPPEQKGPSR